MPTTSLPGIGASIRIVRAARAIARSSARPSIRESLTWRSGRTSYWVTTGPVFVATTVAGMPKLLSLSSMIRMLSSWFARVVVTGGSGTIVSRSIGGRIHLGPSGR